ATIVFAALLIACGFSAFFAESPGVLASSRNCLRSDSVDTPAWGPGSQLTSSKSRPFFADQKFVATTATARGSSTTCVTPGTAFTFSALNDFTPPPTLGACATTATC